MVVLDHYKESTILCQSKVLRCFRISTILLESLRSSEIPYESNPACLSLRTTNYTMATVLDLTDPDEADKIRDEIKSHFRSTPHWVYVRSLGDGENAVAVLVREKNPYAPGRVMVVKRAKGGDEAKQSLRKEIGYLTVRRIPALERVEGLSLTETARLRTHRTNGCLSRWHGSTLLVQFSTHV